MSKRLIPDGGNDTVYTPKYLAELVVSHFREQIHDSDLVLEPCYGSGAFIRAFKKYGLCNIKGLELDRGSDFFEFHQKVDWIITNPPWSKTRDFLTHSYKLADNIVFLITVNHIVGLRRRLTDMYKADFGIKEIFLVDTPPPPWPQSGFQLGAVHLRKNWSKPTIISKEDAYGS